VVILERGAEEAAFFIPGSTSLPGYKLQVTIDARSLARRRRIPWPGKWRNRSAGRASAIDSGRRHRILPPAHRRASRSHTVGDDSTVLLRNEARGLTRKLDTEEPAIIGGHDTHGYKRVERRPRPYTK
jgi:hypothetical protein